MGGPRPAPRFCEPSPLLPGAGKLITRNPPTTRLNMSTELEHDPDFERTRYRLLAQHSDRLAQLYRATRVPANLEAQSMRPGNRELAPAAANLGRMLLDDIEAEHEHARAVLYGVADDSDDARLVSRLNWTSHVLEQTEALAAQVAAEADGDS